MIVRHIDIPAEKAIALRELLRQEARDYVVFADAHEEIRKRITELVGPLSTEEYPALCKHTDRIEVVSHSEYLRDVNKERWH